MSWRNSNFQTDRFIIGACNTPDEAYRVLRLQAQDRKQALAHAQAAARRWQAGTGLRTLQAHLARTLSTLLPFLGEWWLGQIEAAEIERAAGAEQAAECWVAAEEELRHIEGRMRELLPHCSFYGRTGELEAAQKAQEHEWAVKQKRRFENMVLAAKLGLHGQQEHIDVLRMLPDSQRQLAYLLHLSKLSPDQVAAELLDTSAGGTVALLEAGKKVEWLREGVRV